MASLFDTKVQGNLVVHSQSSNQKGYVFEEYSGDESNYGGLRPLQPFNIKLGTQENPWLHAFSGSFQLYQGEGAEKARYGRLWVPTKGTTSNNGEAQLILGNNFSKGVSGNAKGSILLYGESSGGTVLTSGNNGTSANNTITLPAESGTLALEGHSHAFENTNIEWKAAEGVTIQQPSLGGSSMMNMYLLRATFSCYFSEDIVAYKEFSLATLESATGIFPNNDTAHFPLNFYSINVAGGQAMLYVKNANTAEIKMRCSTTIPKQNTHTFYIAGPFGQF